ncbi:hypothetical protein SAMN06297251_10447 [Fulvimarina manganoxydans]|uniref:Uncharacterized protein n=1 Tax=Fulvimarina manganoxydans TaxID=937218 RepID=A0A1W2A9H4_9HYPH|nr:hypothetical protein [Fulvimarina manganoxydans]SMC57375.1 hypothetical protein SAMN06297251_10447 [Fulvimarina manganoxydans]
MKKTGSGYIYSTLPNELRTKAKCQILARIKGDKFFRSLGDTTSVTGTRTLEESEVYSNETPDKDLALTDITKNEMSFNFVLRQMTAFAKKILFQSEEVVVSQAAVAAEAASFVGIAAGDIADLDHHSISQITVECAATQTAYVEGTNYVLDGEMGRLEIVAHPAGATVAVDGTADIDVVYDADAADVVTYGPASKTDVRAEIIIRQNNRWGPSFDYELWDMQMRPDGDLIMGQDGDDFGEMTIVGRAYADSTKAPEYRIGRVRQIPKAA